MTATVTRASRPGGNQISYYGSLRNPLARMHACVLLLLGIWFYAASAGTAESLELDRQRGKVVLVDFWASWCEPCRLSFPWLNEMQQKYAGRLVVIGVNVDSDRAAANRFLARVPAHFEVIYDPEGELAARYDVIGMPSSFVFDTSGSLVDTHIGFRKASRVEREAQLQKLLAPSQPQSSAQQ